MGKLLIRLRLLSRQLVAREVLASRKKGGWGRGRCVCECARAATTWRVSKGPPKLQAARPWLSLSPVLSALLSL